MSENVMVSRLKLTVWSISAGIIVAFFFSMNFLNWATSFNPGGSVLFVSPLMCGLILGIITCEMDPLHNVTSVIVLTITATIGVILTLMSPFIFGIVADPTGITYFIYLPQNMMITIILVLPLSLLGSFLGRLFAENTILSSSLRGERDALKAETDEWYRMLEEKLEEKKAVLEKLQKEQESSGLLNVQQELPPPPP